VTTATEDKTVQDPGQTEDAPKDKQPTPEEAKAARRAKIDKLSLTAQQQAANKGSDDKPTVTGDFDDVDLDGVDAKTAAAIRKALDAGKSSNEHLRTMARFSMEQVRKVKALEIARDFDLDTEETAEIEKALSGANTPEQADLAARGLVITLREDGSFAKADAPAKKPKAESKDGRQFDSGRSAGGAKVNALLDKIEEIDPSDPEAEKKLAALKKEVDAAQRAFMERVNR